MLSFVVFSRLQRTWEEIFLEEAWLMMLQPHSELITREVIGHSEAGGPEDVQIPPRWNKLL